MPDTMYYLDGGEPARHFAEQEITKMKNIGLILSVAATLVACGGGGSSSAVSASASVNSFPLQDAYKALLANGMSKTFSVSGTCAGSGSKTVAPATTAATFEGVAALSAVSTVTINLTNCNPSSTAQTYTSYLDSNYSPLGFNSVGVNYGLFLTKPSIPATVSVGDTAVIGTENLYTNSSKTVGNGTVVLSYAVQPDTASTAIINLISKNYNATGTLVATEQDLYRINATGTLTPISADIQYANGSTTHLVLTYN